MKIRIKNANIPQKNEKYTLNIIDYGSNGEGVAKIDGYTIFVPFAIVGEQVEVTIIKSTKDFAIAKILNIVKASPKRVQAPCVYFQKCGGCQLQHMKYGEQLVYKTQFVKNTLEKYTKTNIEVKKCIESNNQYGYRNKFAFPVFEKGGKICVGMYRILSHDGIELDECKIQQESKDIIFAFLDYANKFGVKAYGGDNLGGVKHIVARNHEDCLLLALVSAEKLRNLEYLHKILTKKYKIVNIINNINTKNNNVILGDKNIVCAGSGELEYNEFDINYKVGVHSFLQVNDDIKTKLYSAVLQNISEEDIVVDGYSGAGLLSAIMAKCCKKVYAVEIIKQAVESAKQLAKSNRIDNLQSICGDCAVELPKILRKNPASIVVLDPPRKGADHNVLDAIVNSNAQKVIYISCNPATLARDLNILFKSFEPTLVQPFDMFPQTANVETLVVLNKKTR